MGRISRRWRRCLADAAWPRPGSAADGGRLGDFEVLAASVVGQGHLHDAAQRQDAYHFAALRDGIVLAVADGVTARPLAAIGAEIAAFAAVRSYLVAASAEAEPPGSWDIVAERMAEAVDRAEGAVVEAAAEMRIAREELSTTLLVADLRRDRAGRIVVTTAGVGNSSALAISPETPPGVIAGPPEGGSPAHYHEFVPGAPGRARLERAVLPAGAALVLATDGLADDLHASERLRAWLWGGIASARTPIEFAHALSYRRQGSNDDLTAVVARSVSP